MTRTTRYYLHPPGDGGNEWHWGLVAEDQEEGGNHCVFEDCGSVHTDGDELSAARLATLPPTLVWRSDGKRWTAELIWGKP